MGRRGEEKGGEGGRGGGGGGGEGGRGREAGRVRGLEIDVHCHSLFQMTIY